MRHPSIGQLWICEPQLLIPKIRHKTWGVFRIIAATTGLMDGGNTFWYVTHFLTPKSGMLRVLCQCRNPGGGFLLNPMMSRIRGSSYWGCWGWSIAGVLAGWKWYHQMVGFVQLHWIELLWATGDLVWLQVVMQCVLYTYFIHTYMFHF